MRGAIKTTELSYGGKVYHVSFNFEVIDLLEENFGLSLEELTFTQSDVTTNENLRRILYILYALIASEDDEFLMNTSFRDFKKSFVLTDIIEYSPVIEEVISNAFPSTTNTEQSGKPKARRATKAKVTG